MAILYSIDILQNTAPSHKKYLKIKCVHFLENNVTYKTFLFQVSSDISRLTVQVPMKIYVVSQIIIHFYLCEK